MQGAVRGGDTQGECVRWSWGPCHSPPPQPHMVPSLSAVVWGAGRKSSPSCMAAVATKGLVSVVGAVKYSSRFPGPGAPRLGAGAGDMLP